MPNIRQDPRRLFRMLGFGSHAPHLGLSLTSKASAGENSYWVQPHARPCVEHAS